MTIYLERDELLDLHLVAVERWGGRLGIRSQDRLQAILAAPRQVMFGVELYPELPDKVAVFGFQMLKHRPFAAGNEATALLGMLRMLAINNTAIEPTGVKALAVALRHVLRSEMNRDQLAGWVRDHALVRNV
jgi:death-on-curing protein